MTQLLLALVAFVGSHFLLSHPLRRPLVKLLGERAFLGIYSLVAFATLAWVILAYHDAPAVFLWDTPAFLYPLARIVMLVAFVLLVGSLIQPNPSLPRPSGPHGEAASAPRFPEQPRGVLAITRHPMMWSFALWGISHAVVTGDAATVALGLAMTFLALVGAKLQERRKRTQFGAAWEEFSRKTAFLPLGAQISGRLPWRSAWPGWLVTVGGVSAFVILLYFHPVLFEVSAVQP